MPVPVISLSTPYRWISAAGALLRNHPRPLISATSLMLAAFVLVVMLQAVLERALAAWPWLQAGLGMALPLLVMAPLTGGYYRLVAALLRGETLRGGEVLGIFRDGEAVQRLIGVQLLFLIATVLLLGLPAFLVGGQPLLEFVTALQALKPDATTLPPLPPGLGPLLIGLLLLAALITAAKELATALVALGAKPPVPAAAAAAALVLRNAGVLLLFFLPVALMLLVAGMLALVVLGVVAGVLMLLSAALAKAFLLVSVLGLVLLLYPLMFGFFYHGWRECLAEGDAAAPPPTAGHQIEA